MLTSYLQSKFKETKANNIYTTKHINYLFFLKKISLPVFIRKDKNYSKILSTYSYGTYLPAELLFKFNRCEKNLSSIWLFSKYLSEIGYSFLGFSTEWFFFNALEMTQHSEIKFLWKKFYRKHRLRELYGKHTSTGEWIIQFMLLKDPTKFIVVVRALILKTILKRHKRVFFFINKLLKFFYINLAKFKKIKGYSLFFKGKLGKKGSVRKAKFFSKKGLISFTNKNLRVNYRTYYVWTYTGVIGGGISVFF